MALLFRDRVLGGSKRHVPVKAATNGPSTPFYSPAADLISPFGELGAELSVSELRITAYEVLVAACRASTAKPLSYTTRSSVVLNGFSGDEELPDPSVSSFSSSFQRSLTSSAASRMKKALGLKSSGSESNGIPFVRESGSPSGKGKKPSTIGELMRIQMGIPEAVDSRIRRAVMRISAGQLGRRIESTVLPLEFLQQLKSSEFSDQQEYTEWQRRNLKLLEAGLLLHPYRPLDKSGNSSSRRLQRLIHEALEEPIDTGRNNEAMQVLRSAVTSLSCKPLNGFPMDTSHWADGFPLNLRIYEMILEACFDLTDRTSLIDDLEELIEDYFKKTWGILGLNPMLHSLCFSWVLFRRSITTDRIEKNLLSAAERQLEDAAKYVKMVEGKEHSKIMNSTLSSMLGWIDKRLLAYHETFDTGNVEPMKDIVSLGVSAAAILHASENDATSEYHRRRRGDADVSRNRVDTYIRSSLRTAFAQKMERADSIKRASNLPVLAVLANDAGDLALKEKLMFSPVLKRWHPLPAGVAVATLHACYGNEIRQFISGISELTPDAVEILRAADKLEKLLVQIAVEDSADSDDGGKSIIREMPPYEAEPVISRLVREWITTRLDRIGEWTDRNVQQETWRNSGGAKDGFAQSAVEVLRVVDETLVAFFQLPIPSHPAMLPELVDGLDACISRYVSMARSSLGSRGSYVPPVPPLTRCSAGSKFGWNRKKDGRRLAGPAADASGPPPETDRFCLCMNTLLRLRTELDSVERRIVTLLRNSESATEDDCFSAGGKRFEASGTAAVEAVRHVSEVMAYKIVFCDLKRVFWDGLYAGGISKSSRADPALVGELEHHLVVVSGAVHERARTRVVTDVMRAAFDAFLLVLLGGGPSRAFACADAQLIEDDFRAVTRLFSADGDGLRDDVIEKFSVSVRDVLPLFKADSGRLIERFRRSALEIHGSMKPIPMPPASGQWSPNDPNTLLRVLCHRNDDVASRFLRKTYNLPKKLN